MITTLIALLILERIAKYTGIEPKVLVWLRKKFVKKKKTEVLLKDEVEVMELKNKKAA